MVIASERHRLFDCPHFDELSFNLPVFSHTSEVQGCKRWVCEYVRFAKLIERGSDAVSSLAFCGFVYQELKAISSRDSWMREVCAQAATASHRTIGRETSSFLRPLTQSFPQRLLKSLRTASLGSILWKDSLLYNILISLRAACFFSIFHFARHSLFSDIFCSK